ncbi:MAG: pantoate--beta-alanine ligase [Candidatus Sulfopaludibacter sp.]|nr:pantoate--beta-alanine ligase [Candidatus Sulfopaludibacter sp.]
MMRVWRSLDQWTERRRAIGGQDAGFVPTMGALHRGHASLVERCRAENQVAVASIFVNPSQFNDPRDLDRYPRTLDRDLALLERLGVDDVLVPAAHELYPNGYRFRIEAGCLTSVMEGAHRPGFLQGVMTIVMKLLHLAGARRAYFGEKDFQQLQAIREMAGDFFIPTEIVACPTVRAASGLAESSRNALLSDTAREKAALIFHALTTAATAAEASATLAAEGFTVDYVEDHWDRRFAAATLGGVRLIDNVPLNPHPQPLSPTPI